MEQVNISWIFLNFAMSGVDMEDASEKGHLFRVRRNFGRNGTKKIHGNKLNVYSVLRKCFLNSCPTDIYSTFLYFWKDILSLFLKH